jgi:hypothetical protein
MGSYGVNAHDFSLIVSIEGNYISEVGWEIEWWSSDFPTSLSH